MFKASLYAAQDTCREPTQTSSGPILAPSTPRIPLHLLEEGQRGASHRGPGCIRPCPRAGLPYTRFLRPTATSFCFTSRHAALPPSWPSSSPLFRAPQVALSHGLAAPQGNRYRGQVALSRRAPSGGVGRSQPLPPIPRGSDTLHKVALCCFQRCSGPSTVMRDASRGRYRECIRTTVGATLTAVTLIWTRVVRTSCRFRCRGYNCC